VKIKIFLVFIFILGIVLRLYPAIIHPLWLDEVYSLYFASNFSYLKIIFRLPDCHPGLFYFFLKFLLHFSTSTIILRTIVGIIPQIIGCLVIQSRFKKPLLTTAFLLNPLFIHLAWQIRMYSLVFLITVLIISLILKPNFSIKKLVVLIFLGNLISYSFIVPSLCLILYLAFFKNKKIIFISLLVILEFFIFKGPQYKTLAETASWISVPSFSNIGSVILTSLGFASDIFSLSRLSIFSSIIFYLVSGYLFYKISKKYSLFLFNVTLPLIVTIILSVFIPFLSQRYFFYLFTPKVSLFIPRFLLPMSVFFYIYIFNYFQHHHKLIIGVLILFWIPTFYSINYKLPYLNTNVINTKNSNIIFLPPSENLRLHSKFTIDDLNNISRIYNSAEIMEKQLLQKPPICTLYSQYFQVNYLEQPVPSLLNYENQIKSALDICANSPH
jgi:hypothetical protein